MMRSMDSMTIIKDPKMGNVRINIIQSLDYLSKTYAEIIRPKAEELEKKLEILEKKIKNK